MTKSLFVECHSEEDKEKLKVCGFTYLPEQSCEGKYIFLNDGKINFSLDDIKLNFHNRANI